MVRVVRSLVVCGSSFSSVGSVVCGSMVVGLVRVLVRLVRGLRIWVQLRSGGRCFGSSLVGLVA